MKMSYVVLGTNNMDAAINFYDSLFEGMGSQQKFKTDRMHYWVYKNFSFAVATPFNEEHATSGNGTMIGFDVESEDEVNRLYAKAIELGGSSEGQPSQKGPMFSAYIRDLDENKICFF
ncbi:MAG: VOC family protein [Bdellovibrionales bacterium]|nr:VOC family protein [Bdellovibrionales bacterium]NQZ18237.1 VOC family protein [Bdellovibrionales bacterium]